MHGAGREASCCCGDDRTGRWVHLRRIESRDYPILAAEAQKNSRAMAHSRLHSTPPAPRTPSSTTRRKQYDEAGALVCAQRRNDVTRCNGIGMPPCGTLCANVTSSTTKPEVHYVSQRRKKRTESRLRAQELARRSEVQFRNVYIGF